ncbi:hypothetical protein [Streptomyces sp. TLI_55]|uniref:hypothetical protein n=1 Tax=Streptomyces sp. TLI_55 TaxID=1938861 RepID=UPI000BE3E2FC|nr:hypothetical protein [Streptomyces sp. TLI_55]
MEPQKPLPEPRQPEGCLVTAIRIPVRIVVLVLVVPVRMAWDALVVAGRFLNDTVLRPLGRALEWALEWTGRILFVWPLLGLWRYLLVPLGKGLAWLGNVLVVVPAVWLYRYLLTPAYAAGAWLVRYLVVVPAVWLYQWILTPSGHGVMWLLRGIGRGIAAAGIGVYTAVAWLVRYLVVVPAVWLYTWVLTPVGRGVTWLLRGIGVALYWVARVVFVLPVLALWRWVLTPVGRFLAVVGREVGDALGHAWRIAGHISLAVGRFLATLFRWVFVEPVRWVYRTVLTPVGHVVRDAVLRPVAQVARGVGRATREALASVRETARQARADFRRMLLGEPREPVAVDRREPTGLETRTLGRSTTALTKD